MNISSEFIRRHEQEQISKTGDKSRQPTQNACKHNQEYSIFSVEIWHEIKTCLKRITKLAQTLLDSTATFQSQRS